MAQSGRYSKLPYSVTKEANLKAHQLRISEQELSRLSILLENCEIAEENWENSQEDGRFGVTRDWLLTAIEYWRHNYDW